jgi:hypothetical protein
MLSGVYSRVLAGWLAGCATATAVTSAFGLIVVVIEESHDPTAMLFLGGSSINLLLVFIDFILICLFTAIPSVIVIWLSERFQVRSAVFFGCMGAAIGALCVILPNWTAMPWTSGIGWLFVVAGLAAGLTYWSVAGKHSGLARCV